MTAFYEIALGPNLTPRPVGGSRATVHKINGFVQLEPGWHFGRGTPPSRLAIQAALALLGVVHQRSVKTDAFPGYAGEVCLCFYSGDDYHEFTVEKTRRVTYVHEYAEEEISELELSLEDAIRIIRDNLAPQWPLSDSSIGATMIPIVQGSRVWRSNLMKTAASQSWTINASQAKAQSFVRTYGISIPASPVMIRSFGVSLPCPAL